MTISIFRIIIFVLLKFFTWPCMRRNDRLAVLRRLMVSRRSWWGESQLMTLIVMHLFCTVPFNITMPLVCISEILLTHIGRKAEEKDLRI